METDKLKVKKKKYNPLIFAAIIGVIMGVFATSFLYKHIIAGRDTAIKKLDLQVSKCKSTVEAEKAEKNRLKKRIDQLTYEYTNIPEEIINWGYKNAKNYVPKSDVQQIIMEASKYKNFYMIISVITEETHYDRYARSEKNAKGLGQIRTKDSKGKSVWLDELIEQGIWESEIDAYDYRKNIAAIDYILNKYHDEKGSWKEALSSYVNGDSNYVTRVLSNFAEISLLMTEIEHGKVQSNAGNPEVHKEGGELTISQPSS